MTAYIAEANELRHLRRSPKLRLMTGMRDSRASDSVIEAPREKTTGRHFRIPPGECILIDATTVLHNSQTNVL